MLRQLELARLNPDLVYEKLWLAAKVIESTLEGLLVTTTEGTIQIVNPAFSTISGFSPEEAITLTPIDLASTYQPTLDMALWDEISEQQTWQGKLWLQRKNGQSFLASTSINAIPPEDGSAGSRYVMLFTEITATQQSEQRQLVFSEINSLIDQSATDLTTFQQIAQLIVVHDLAGYCLIHLNNDPEKRPVGMAASNHRTDIPSTLPIIAEVMQSGTDRTASQSGIDVICVPILLNSKLRGTLTLVSSSIDRIPYPADLSMAHEIATRLARLLETSGLNNLLTQFQTSLDATSDGIIIYEPTKFDFLYVNQALATMLGYDRNELLTKHGTDISPDFTPEGFERAVHDLRKGKSISLLIEHKLRRSDGSLIPVEVNIQFIPSTEGSGQFLAIIRDLSERQRIEQQLKKITTEDTLTKLPNRSRLLDVLNENIRQIDHESYIALLYIDLDRFKVINDTLGYRVGDKLLIEVSHRLLKVIREQDLLARIGGDEFALILDGLDSGEHAIATAEDILAQLHTPFVIEGHELHVTPSIGIAMYPDDGSDAADLLQNAEIALYLAKQHGRNAYRFYAASLNATALERLVMENSLRHALERKEFVVNFQPHVELSSGCVVGAEALVRWHHPELGIIQPKEFITLAEETGLLGTIDNWVLEECCRQLAAWRGTASSKAYLSINLSTQQLRQDDFAGRLQHLLTTYAIPPENLELEMTESIVMDNAESTIRLLREIRDTGVRLALDDFGTGYSSLSHLKRLPIDILKIDQSFVRDCLNSDNDSAIITAITSIAHSLGLEVVAEGVEQKEQLEFLQTLGCDYIQGFLFSRPLTARRFLGILRRQPFLSKAA